MRFFFVSAFDFPMKLPFNTNITLSSACWCRLIVILLEEQRNKESCQLGFLGRIVASIHRLLLASSAISFYAFAREKLIERWPIKGAIIHAVNETLPILLLQLETAHVMFEVDQVILHEFKGLSRWISNTLVSGNATPL